MPTRNRMHWTLWAVVLAGCTELTLQGADGRLDRSFLGHVRVRGAPLPGQSSGGSVHDFTTTGLSVGHGLTFGFVQERLVQIPLDCKVVVIAEPDRALSPAFIDSLKQVQACWLPPLANQPRSPP